MKRQLKIWLECFRLRTLPVSLSGVVIAIGLAKWHHHFQWTPALLCLAFALLAQIVSNTANEYFDYLKGADKPGRVGPRRGVTEGDIKPKTLRNVTFALLALACAWGHVSRESQREGRSQQASVLCPGTGALSVSFKK